MGASAPPSWHPHPCFPQTSCDQGAWEPPEHGPRTDLSFRPSFQSSSEGRGEELGPIFPAPTPLISCGAQGSPEAQRLLIAAECLCKGGMLSKEMEETDIPPTTHSQTFPHLSSQPPFHSQCSRTCHSFLSQGSLWALEIRPTLGLTLEGLSSSPDNSTHPHSKSHITHVHRSSRPVQRYLLLQEALPLQELLPSPQQV